MVERLDLSYTTENGDSARNPSAPELLTRVEALAAGSGNAYVVCDRIPGREGNFIQSLANPDGTFVLETATDGPATHLSTVVATAAEVVAAIAAWSRDDPAWQAAHVWKPVLPPLEPLDPQLAAEAAEYARDQVATGFVTRDEAVVAVYEYFCGSGADSVNHDP